MKNINLKQLQGHLSKPRLSSKQIVFVRSAESTGNISGSLTGWMNSKLTDFGRKQAFSINRAIEDVDFSHWHSSDLDRSVETAIYALGFPSDEDQIKKSKDLREIHFGANEGLHYDSLPDSEKEKINKPDYKAPDGESWLDLEERGREFIESLEDGHHLVFTHGGWLAAMFRD